MTTRVPRSERSANGRPWRSGNSTSGMRALSSARPPDSGPSAHSPYGSSATSALPSRSESTRAAGGAVAEPLGEHARVEWAVGQRHAHVGLARAFGLDLPAGARDERAGVDLER